MRASGDTGVYAVQKSISFKMNRIAQIEFEMTFYDIAVKQIGLYATGTTARGLKQPKRLWNERLGTGTTRRIETFNTSALLDCSNHRNFEISENAMKLEKLSFIRFSESLQTCAKISKKKVK